MSGKLILKQYCRPKYILYIFTVFIAVLFAWLFISGLYLTGGQALSALINNGWFQRSLRLTLLTAFITTFIAILLGIPAAYTFSHFDFPFKNFLEIIFTSLMVLPASSIGLMLMVAFQYDPFLRIQEYFNLRLVHSLPGIVIAQLVLALAFGINAWRSAFDAVNPRFEYVARSLGSSRLQAFFTVVLPTAKTGIIAGIMLAFTRAIAEFGAVLIMSSTFRFRDISHFSAFSRFLGIEQADILSVAMWMEMEEGHMEQGVAMAFIMLFITALFIYLLKKVRNKNKDLRL